MTKVKTFQEAARIVARWEKANLLESEHLSKRVAFLD
jgi:hypothetical protein